MNCDYLIRYCFKFCNYIDKMPKLIDNYILEDKIGAGQFGDVFKGHHK